MSKSIKFFEDSLKISASIALLLVLAGYFELSTYYSKFGIRITEFISTSEILLSSLPSLIELLISILVQLIVWFIFFDYLFDYDLEESMRDGVRRPKDGHDETIHRFVNNKRIINICLVFFALFLITEILHVIFPQDKFWRKASNILFLNTWIIMCIYLGLIQATRAFWIRIKGNSQYNGKLLLTSGIFFLTFIFTIWVNNLFKYGQIMKYGNDTPLSITLKNQTVISQTDTIKYLGRTEKYFFYWNWATKKTKIYPTSEIVMINTN